MNILRVEIKIDNFLLFILVACRGVILIPTKDIGVFIITLFSELNKLLLFCLYAQERELYLLIAIFYVYEGIFLYLVVKKSFDIFLPL